MKTQENFILTEAQKEELKSIILRISDKVRSKVVFKTQANCYYKGATKTAGGTKIEITPENKKDYIIVSTGYDNIYFIEKCSFGILGFPFTQYYLQSDQNLEDDYRTAMIRLFDQEGTICNKKIVISVRALFQNKSNDQILWRYSPVMTSSCIIASSPECYRRISTYSMITWSGSIFRSNSDTRSCMCPVSSEYIKATIGEHNFHLLGMFKRIGGTPEEKKWVESVEDWDSSIILSNLFSQDICQNKKGKASPISALRDEDLILEHKTKFQNVFKIYLHNKQWIFVENDNVGLVLQGSKVSSYCNKFGEWNVTTRKNLCTTYSSDNNSKFVYSEALPEKANCYYGSQLHEAFVTAMAEGKVALEKNVPMSTPYWGDALDIRYFRLRTMSEENVKEIANSRYYKDSIVVNKTTVKFADSDIFQYTDNENVDPITDQEMELLISKSKGTNAQLYKSFLSLKYEKRHNFIHFITKGIQRTMIPAWQAIDNFCPSQFRNEELTNPLVFSLTPSALAHWGIYSPKQTQLHKVIGMSKSITNFIMGQSNICSEVKWQIFPIIRMVLLLRGEHVTDISVEGVEEALRELMGTFNKMYRYFKEKDLSSRGSLEQIWDACSELLSGQETYRYCRRAELAYQCAKHYRDSNLSTCLKNITNAFNILIVGLDEQRAIYREYNKEDASDGYSADAFYSRYDETVSRVYHLWRDMYSAIQTVETYLNIKIGPLSITNEQELVFWHDKYTQRSTEVQQQGKENAFKSVSQKWLKYEYTDGVYSVVAPKAVADVIKEGESLHHCVGSYIDATIAGQTNVLFIRKNSALQEPFVTFDITDSGMFRQAFGQYNSQIPQDVYEFLVKWGKTIKGVQLDSIHSTSHPLCAPKA